MSASIVTMKKPISRILLSACFNHTFPTDAVTCQCSDGGTQYILVEQIHNAQLQKCLKKTLSMLIVFWANLFCLFWVWRWLAPLLKQILLGFCYIPVNPHLRICDYLRREFLVSLKPLLNVVACADMVLSWSSVSTLGTNLAAIWRTFRLSFKMLKTDPNEISNISNLQILIILFLRTKSFTWSMFSPVLLVDWHPECSASSTGVTLVLNTENTQKLVFSPRSALQNYYQHFKSLHSIFTSIKQNVMVSCCFYKSADIANVTTHTCTLQQSAIIRFATALVQARNNSADYTPAYI